VSADARADNFSCQQNIVLRNNIARWPRAGGKERLGPRCHKNDSAPAVVGLNCSAARTFADCDCSGVPADNVRKQQRSFVVLGCLLMMIKAIVCQDRLGTAKQA